MCMHEEERGRIPYQFRRWSEYEEHMRLVHQLVVTKDGARSSSTQPKRIPLDEL